MRVKSLEIQGFKSFPDKTILNFEKGISAVVGPNGSGKSNISDAIRWVLGEQSSKSLRGTKSEDVIFSGTVQRKPMGFAQVTLTIDNLDRKLSYDKDDVTITRQYYRSGNSEYLINNENVRLRDINELFMDTGLGKDGYSIISQGKISEIMDGKPSDRREIFEEAAGISKFKYKKEEALHRLDLAEENLVRLRDILSEIENRVEPLRKQSEKATAFLNYSNDKKQLEIDLAIHTITEVTKTLSQIGDKITIAQEDYNSIEKVIDDLEKEIEENFSKSQQLNADADTLRRDISKKEENSIELESNIKVIKNDIFHNDENIKRLNGEISYVYNSSVQFEQTIAEKQKQVDSIDLQIISLENVLNKIIEDMEKLKNSSSGYDEQLINLNNEIISLNESISDKKATIITLQISQNQNNEKKITLEQNQKELKIKYDEMVQRLCDHTKKIDEYNEKTVSLKNSSKGYEMRYNSQLQKLEQKQQSLNKLNLDIEQNKRKMKILEDLEKNMEGFSNSVKSVMTASQRGFLKGVAGIVSRLFKVEPKLATAIEIALGGAMQNIVVQNQEDAKRAIAYLKNNNSGRATFLPIDVIKGNVLNEQGLQNCEGFIGIASQVIECDNVYRNIMNNLLGRVVVCEDIDSATAIARRYSYRFRLVTLDGQVVNAGGSMTGGSLNRNAGILGRSGQIESIAQEIEKLLKSSTVLTQEVEKINELTKIDKNEIVKISDEIKAINDDLIRVSTEKKNLDERLSRLKKSIDECNEELKVQLLKSDEYTTKIQEFQLQYDKHCDEQAKKQSEISKLTGKQNEFTQSIEQYNSQISENKFKTLSLQKDMIVLNQSIDETKSRQRDNNSQIAQMQSQIKQYTSKNFDLQNNIQEIELKVKDYKIEIEKDNTQIESLIKQREQCEKNATQLRNSEREKNSQKEKITVELTRIIEQKSTTERTFNELIKKLWDEYELTKKEAEVIAKPIENMSQLQRDLNEIRIKIKELGSVNLSAIEEYKEVSQRYTFLKGQMDDIEQSKNQLTSLIDDLTTSMVEKFTTSFKAIQGYFTTTYKELFGGGYGEISLTDPSDVLSSGIEIKAQPKGKLITNINALSGGEKSLTSIALYFAIMRYSPTPFCVLDEIEAALDDVNVDRFAHYLRKMCNDTQFVVITHRRGTMQEADTLYGVTMQNNGISKLLTLNVEQAKLIDN